MTNTTKESRATETPLEEEPSQAEVEVLDEEKLATVCGGQLGWMPDG